MLKLSIHLIPKEEKTQPWYIVMQHNLESDKKFYVKHFAVSRFPIALSDDIYETSENIWEAERFCKLNDAKEIAELCDFKCNFHRNCNHIHVGRIFQLTYSGRKEENVTYGIINNVDGGKRYFEVAYDIAEITR